MTSNYSSNDNYFIITIEENDRVRKAKQDLSDGWNDCFEFIYNTYQKILAVTNDNDINDSRVLRTPSRRISKRKRSSVAVEAHDMSPKVRSVAKRSVSAGFKTRELMATPKRVSKRSKASIVQLMDKSVENIEPMEVDVMEVIEDIPEVVNKENVEICENFEKIQIENNDNIDNNEEIQNNIDINSELFSELSINDDNIKVENKEPKLNESDKEWLTDDEDSSKKRETEEFFDAIENKEKNEMKANMNSSINANNKTIITAKSKAKQTRKKSMYFTPQSSVTRSTRAKTRINSRIAESSKVETQTTPQTKTQVTSRLRNSAQRTSGETNTQPTGGSSTRSMRYCSRLQKQDTQGLTASALKKRQEAEEHRIQKLMASQEKEKRAIEKRRILIEQTVNEKKIRSQEKASKAAEKRELHKQLESERLKKEQQRREEMEKRLKKTEDERKELLRKKQEELHQKAIEMEKRKQIQDQKNMEMKIRRQEELERKQELERNRIKEEERMAALIQQHNNSLQQKAVANSFIKKCNLVPKLVLTKLSPQECKAVEAPKVSPQTQTEPQNKSEEISNENKTFVVSKEEQQKDISCYDMTPPPKEHDYDNYDISEIQSDDDTDDDQQPRKRIPQWARGQQFINQVIQQYNKSTKLKEREVRHIFGLGDVILTRFKTDFDLMFPKTIHPKYAKRTSSAVWEDPPSRYRDISLNESSIH